eukprot:TRINITY_DN166_c0_g1_i4.p1 TRINITY_DN166_c0_g1~~TRINITY_DN166_c0_g1_i4.p1  ORF type:complete len:761 (+),score=227.69 TRINITY_DN166_c0_g1_i4:220-2502(+)
MPSLSLGLAKNSFYDGDDVTGTVFFRVTKPLFVGSVTVQFTVTEDVNFTEECEKKEKKEKGFQTNMLLDSGPVVLQAGCHLEDITHAWDFSFKIPQGFPPSLDLGAAKVTYEVKAIVIQKKKNNSKAHVEKQKLNVCNYIPRNFDGKMGSEETKNEDDMNMESADDHAKENGVDVVDADAPTRKNPSLDLVRASSPRRGTRSASYGSSPQREFFVTDSTGNFKISVKYNLATLVCLCGQTVNLEYEVENSSSSGKITAIECSLVRDLTMATDSSHAGPALSTICKHRVKEGVPCDAGSTNKGSTELEIPPSNKLVASYERTGGLVSVKYDICFAMTFRNDSKKTEVITCYVPIIISDPKDPRRNCTDSPRNFTRELDRGSIKVIRSKNETSSPLALSSGSKKSLMNKSCGTISVVQRPPPCPGLGEVASVPDSSPPPPNSPPSSAHSGFTCPANKLKRFDSTISMSTISSIRQSVKTQQSSSQPSSPQRKARDFKKNHRRSQSAAGLASIKKQMSSSRVAHGGGSSMSNSRRLELQAHKTSLLQSSSQQRPMRKSDPGEMVDVVVKILAADKEEEEKEKEKEKKEKEKEEDTSPVVFDQLSPLREHEKKKKKKHRGDRSPNLGASPSGSPRGSPRSPRYDEDDAPSSPSRKSKSGRRSHRSKSCGTSAEASNEIPSLGDADEVVVKRKKSSRKKHHHDDDDNDSDVDAGGSSPPPSVKGGEPVVAPSSPLAKSERRKKSKRRAHSDSKEHQIDSVLAASG